MSEAIGINVVTLRATDSSRFGTSTVTSTHEFTGSVGISGSFSVRGVSNLSASYAITASYALNGGGSGSGVSVSISDTAPVSPTTGSLWWDSTVGQLRIWYVDVDSGQWVDALGNSGVWSTASYAISASYASNGGGSSYSPVITDSTTSRTLALSDAGKWIRFTNGAAISVTVPPQSGVTWVADTETTLEQAGAGQITVATGSGVTVNSSTTLKTFGQYSVIGLKRVASDTWTLTGERA